ncbi:MAG: alpha/beta hydrolase [Prevotellaceae bacterium]|jgi:acetyl esterase/lipase|nr:alpha/beta hydrolase [Prevotellaceae bacterium]
MMIRSLHFFVYILFPAILASQEVPVQIWEGVTSHTEVTLTPYLPAVDTCRHTAVIICPGGSYCWLDTTSEGTDVARYLQRRGIAAFVLRYRTAGVLAFITHNRLLWHGNQHPDMIQDLQRAIEWVRIHAEMYQIRDNRIGVMGFSAGGHLALTAAERFDTNFMAPLGIQPRASLRPDFVAALYPVVTLSDSRYTHRRSRRGLLGENKKRNIQMRDSLSAELHVRTDMPPVFLMNCKDDPVVKPQNALLLDSALTAHAVPHHYLQYTTGGHGFGIHPRAGADSADWIEQFINWLFTIIHTTISHEK